MKVNKFLGNTVKYCIPSIVSAIIGIAVIPIISRVYPADDYGKINLFYSVGNMVLCIVLLGLDSAYIRFYYEGFRGTKGKDLFPLAFWTALGLDVLLCAVCILIFPDTAGKYLFGERNNKMLLAMGLYVIGLLLFRLLSIDTRMDNRALVYNLQQISLMVSNRISFVLITFLTTDYQTSILVITASTLILSLIFTVLLKKSRDFAWKPLSGDTYKAIMLFAIPLMPTTVMTWLNNSVSKMVLSSYNDFAAVGVLSIATSIANVFSVIPAAFCTYWSAFMYKNYTTENGFIKKVHNYICLLSLVMIWGIFVFQDVLYFIVGPEYADSQKYFMLIMLGPIQSLLCETTSYGIILKNKTKYNLYISVAAVLVNVAVSYMLYPVYGSLSAAIGIGTAAVIQLVMKTVIGQKNYSSIVSKKTTILGVTLMLLLILSNIAVWDRFMLRLAGAVVTGVMCVLVYRKEIREIADYAVKFAAKLKKS